MLQNILLSAPVVLLFLFLALRCLEAWGAPFRLPGFCPPPPPPPRTLTDPGT